MKNLIVTGALALGITVSGFAAAANSDLIIGFRDTSGAITTSFEVDLGQASTFNRANYSTLSEVVNLNSVRGWTLSVWGGTSSTLNVAIFGSSGNTSTTRVLWGSQIARSSLLDGVSTTYPYWSGTSSSQAANGAGAIAALYMGATFSANTGYTIANSSTRSYNSIFTKTTGGLTAFNPKATLEGTLGSSDPIAFDLYELNPTDTYPDLGTQFVGTFALYGNGDLKFIAAVPEPSTYAVVLGAVIFGIAAFRCRLVKA